MQKPIFTTAAAVITLSAITAYPAQARFLQTDPVGYEDQVNLYTYVGNDPINAVDPTGERCVAANGWSGYCRRAKLYAGFDLALHRSTRFFAAASATSNFLANNDLPGSGIFSGFSSTTRSFLNQTASNLEAFNSSAAKSIEAGQSARSGRALDSQLVRAEQARVQLGLNGLSESARSQVVGEINASFQRAIDNPGLFTGNRAYQVYVETLTSVQKQLGTNIDFGNEDHRVAIGDALVERVRQNSNNCTQTGSRIRTC